MGTSPRRVGIFWTRTCRWVCLLGLQPEQEAVFQGRLQGACKWPETGHVVIVVSLGAGIHVTRATGVWPPGTCIRESVVRVRGVPKEWEVGIKLGLDRAWAVFRIVGPTGAGSSLTPQVVIPHKLWRCPQKGGGERIRIRLVEFWVVVWVSGVGSLRRLIP